MKTDSPARTTKAIASALFCNNQGPGTGGARDVCPCGRRQAGWRFQRFTKDLDSFCERTGHPMPKGAFRQCRASPRMSLGEIEGGPPDPYVRHASPQIPMMVA